MKQRKRNRHVGSSLDVFLKDEAIFEETQTKAVKEVVAWQLAEAVKSKRVSKARMAMLLRTSRTEVDRLLDAETTSHCRVCKRRGVVERP